MKRTILNPISKKRIEQKRKEAIIRAQLEERCHGKCEECGVAAYWPGLSPHEEYFRSHGGEMSLENSKMLCIKCHGTKHGVNYIIDNNGGKNGN